jgi:hypothetical protein
MDLLEIISVHFNVTHQLLIIYSACIEYLKNGNTMGRFISYLGT